MRKILISKRGEFRCKVETNYLRGSAVKKLASVMRKSDGSKAEGGEVVVSSEKCFKKSQPRATVELEN